MSEKEYKKLFHIKYNSFCNYAYSIVKNESEAEDVVQEVFIDFWKNYGDKEYTIKIENYFIRAIKYKCIDVVRKRIVSQKYLSEARHITSNHDFVESAEKDSVDISQLVNLAIDQLPSKTKEVFVLSKIKKLSYKQIASHLNISEKTVENQMARAFKQLRLTLKEYRFFSIFLLLFLLFLLWSSGLLKDYDYIITELVKNEGY